MSEISEMYTHNEIRELLGAYALDAVEPDESGAVEAHLDRCVECAAEIDQYLLVASVIAGPEEAAPDSVWDRVEAAIDSEEGAGGATVIPFRRRLVSTLTSVAAAVLLAVVGIQAIQISSLRGDVDASNRVIATIETQIATGDFSEALVLAATQPGSQALVLAGDLGSAKVVLLANGTGYLELADMAPVDSDHVYQLWAVQSGKVISAGLMGSSPTITPFHVDPTSLEGLVLTVEEAGGVVTSAQAPAAAWLPEA
jgi:hypothetical protein